MAERKRVRREKKRAEQGHVFIQIPGKHVCVNLPKIAGAQVYFAN